MKLLIAEKPSVAKSIARVLGAEKRQEGYLEGGGVLVSWCLGHLAEFADAETYDDRYGKWCREDLPIIPDPWQFCVSRDKKKQLDLLTRLMHREDVTEVINACDAGREGELIFRTVCGLAGCTKPVKRLWISSLEESAIQEGLADLRDGSEYDGLYASALCRSKADWLVGINATRLFSVLYHRTLNIGRVISPTLALLAGREAEIAAFEPEPFWTVNLDVNGLRAGSDRLGTRAEAEALAEAAETSGLVVRSVVKTERTKRPPALYDLTALQREANRTLGFTAQQTLDYLQSLYEKKLCTYPRSDSRYLTGDMESGVEALALCCAGICGTQIGIVLSDQVCDSARVSDHHAIIPTAAAGEANPTMIPAGERALLLLLARRVLCAVSEPFVYEETITILDCGGAAFTTRTFDVKSLGWRVFTEQADKAAHPPILQEGQRLRPDSIRIKEEQTVAPRHFTEDTLLAAMEKAGAKELPDDAERRGLGTPATRAAILEKLISSGLAERRVCGKSAHLVPTVAGMSLITVLPEELQSPLLTAEWEQKLKMIERGELDPDSFMAEITAMIRELVTHYEVIPGAEVLFPSGRTVVGKCPRCGGDVTESRNGFFCERNDCRFALWRDNRFLAAKRVDLNRKMAEQLLRDGRAFSGGLYSEKTGKSYSAYIVLEDDGSRSSYRLEFDRQENND